MLKVGDHVKVKDYNFTGYITNRNYAHFHSLSYKVDYFVVGDNYRLCRLVNNCGICKELNCLTNGQARWLIDKEIMKIKGED